MQLVQKLGLRLSAASADGVENSSREANGELRNNIKSV